MLSCKRRSRSCKGAFKVVEFCKKCRIRSAVIYTRAGDYCLLCAKEKQIPKWELIPSALGYKAAVKRVGRTPFDLDNLRIIAEEDFETQQMQMILGHITPTPPLAAPAPAAEPPVSDTDRGDSMKLCERCQKKPAVVFVVQKIGDERKTRDYCIQCAKELDIPQVKEYMRDNGITDEDFERMSEQMLQMTEAQSEKPAVPEQKPKRCSFCGKRDAVCTSENGAYQLCSECCFLLYPQMDVQAVTAQGIPIEKAVSGRKPPNPCAVCGIREAQFFRTDGNFCIACAKRQNLPEADKMARRMGISGDDLTAFAEAAAASDAPQETAPAASVAQQPERFEITDRSTVDGKELLVLRDNFTGIHYLTNGQFSAFTPLLDGSGKPFVFIG